MQNRQLQTWLSEDEYAQVGTEWQEQFKLCKELKDKPDELKSYEDKLKEALIKRNRSDAYHRKGKRSANSLKGVKRLLKEFDFTAGMLKASLAEGRKKK